jgi:hypothetical protein
MPTQSVICVVEMDRWEHFERHWLWCVWFNGFRKDHEPNEYGFSTSEKEAENAAWEVLRKNADQSQRIFVRYCHDLGSKFFFDSAEAQAELKRLRDEVREINQRPTFSRCSIGKDRWFWVVGCEYDYELNGYSKPSAEGITDSSEAALKLAVEACGPVRLAGNQIACGYHKQTIAERKMERTTKSTKTSLNEFAYLCDGFTEGHRIVKKTPKFIYVEHDPARHLPTNTWRDYSRKTFRLDRQQFEKHGKAERLSNRYQTYYSDPDVFKEEGKLSSVPLCFVELGMTEIGTLEQVKGAYKRLAKKHHPDAGGHAEDFKKLCSTYEAALCFLKETESEI